MSKETIWNYLINNRGFSPEAAAGVMGNIMAESSCIPNNLQNNGNKKLGKTDQEYTDEVDKGTYTNFVHDSFGYGLCQWTYWSRKQGLYNQAKSRGTSIADIYTQLDYMISEYEFSATLRLIRSLKSPAPPDTIWDVTYTMLTTFEKPDSILTNGSVVPGSKVNNVAKARFDYAIRVYNEFCENKTYQRPNINGTADSTNAANSPSDSKYIKPKRDTTKYESGSGSVIKRLAEAIVTGVDISDIVKIDNSEKLKPKYTNGTNLLSFPTHVETPFIIAKIGSYTFGDHSIRKSGNEMNVSFPNFMKQLEITKINGDVNKYTLTMEYQIGVGDDPNLLDKVFGSISNTRKITLSYGDWSAPAFAYKEETALITKIVSNIDFSGSRITYTLNCISDGHKAKSTKHDFPARTNIKPSTVIKDTIIQNIGNIQEIFPGMKGAEKIVKLIPHNDKAVNIPAKKLTDPLSYINYLVSIMTSDSTKSDTLNSSRYFLTIKDDVNNEYGGTYFEITEVRVTKESADTVVESLEANSIDTFVLDIGYPSDNHVTQFSIKNDDEWAILYNYSEQINSYNKNYSIDNGGNIIEDKDLSLMLSGKTHTVTETQRSWWSNVTQFPVEATVTIKGLLRPAILMSYVRINSYFYGSKHISSGLYIITKQVDRINSSGYTTTLSLLRIAADSEF